MKRLLTLTAAALCALATSCNKEDNTPTPTPDPDPTPSTDCRITALRAGGDAALFSYDGDKRLVSYEYQESGTTTTKRTFAYAGDFIVSVTTESGVPKSRDTVRLNSAGYITSTVSVSLPADTVKQRTMYEYNGDKVSKATIYGVNPGNQPYTILYEYDSDGNISKETQSGGSVTTYAYYTDKTARPGGFFEVQSLLGGRGKLFNNTHLLKTETRSGSITTYTYDYDGNDRITKYTITRPGSATTSVNVEQSCD